MQEIDLILQGQSNAANIVSSSTFDLMPLLAQEVTALLGYTSSTLQVNLIDAETTYPGTPFVPDPTRSFLDPWVNYANGQDSTGGWTDQPVDGTPSLLGDEVTSFESLPADVLAAPMVLNWLHNENDSSNPDITTAEEESAIRYDAAQVRAIFTGPVTYEFVDGLPYINAIDTSAQAIKIAFQDLADDPSFNAGLIQSDDVNMDLMKTSSGAQLYGGPHLDEADAVQLIGRMAAADAVALASIALPGSPVALDEVDATGPVVTGAVLDGDSTLILSLAIPANATSALSLNAQALAGIGWSVIDGGVVANGAEVGAADGNLVVTFSQAIPVTGTLYYAYGSGRLAAPTTVADPVGFPGEGNAIYDSNGMPLSAPATGVAIDAPGAIATSYFVNGSGNATVLGSSTTITTVAGGAGSVLVQGGGAGVLAFGGSAGDNAIYSGAGDSTIVAGGNGDQLYVSGSGEAQVWGGAGDETISAKSATGNSNFLIGGSGDDLIEAGDGSTVFGGAGGVIGTGAGASLIVEGAGSEFTYLNAGDSTLFGGTGQDIYAETDGISGGFAEIVGFKQGTDKIYVGGYPSGEIANVLANAVSGSNYSYLRFSDGSSIAIFGVNSLSASDLI